MDIVAAFLHSPLKEEIYIEQPKGYIDPNHPDWVCRLLKSLYGLKQAPFEWNKSINMQLRACGFIPLDADLCIYILNLGGGLIAIITIHVDNCTIAAHHSLLAQAKAALTSKFQMKDLGEVESILGMEIVRDQPARKLFILMRAYIVEALGLFNMSDCRPVATPMVPSLKLEKLTVTAEADRALPYHQAVGKLLYLAISCRPDIYYTVHYLSLFVNGWSTEHWQAIKRVLRYLKGTANLALCYD
jgi:hypothetical protein